MGGGVSPIVEGARVDGLCVLLFLVRGTIKEGVAEGGLLDAFWPISSSCRVHEVALLGCQAP